MLKRKIKAFKIYPETLQKEEFELTIGQNCLPWHKGQFSTLNIAQNYMRHKDIHALVKWRNSDIVTQPFFPGKSFRLTEAFERAGKVRTRYGAYKVKPHYTSALLYVDDVTGELEGWDPFPWNKSINNPRHRFDIPLDCAYVYKHFSILDHRHPEQQRPAIQWCWMCQQFFTIADSYLFTGGKGRYRHEIRDYNDEEERKKGCTYFVCPVCFCCDQTHVWKNFPADSKELFDIFGPIKIENEIQFQLLEQISRGAMHTKLTLLQSKGFRRKQKAEQHIENLEIPDWKIEIMLGHQSKPVFETEEAHAINNN